MLDNTYLDIDQAMENNAWKMSKAHTKEYLAESIDISLAAAIRFESIGNAVNCYAYLADALVYEMALEILRKEEEIPF